MDTERQARLDFVVELDKRSYSKIQTSLHSLFKERHNLTIGEKGVEKLRDQLLGVMGEAGSSLNKGLVEGFDTSISKFLSDIGRVQEQIKGLGETADEGQLKALLKQQENIEKQMEVAIKSHKASRELREALKSPLKPETWKKVSEGLGEGFLSTLNKAKSGDIAGLTEALASGIGKAVSATGGAAKMGGDIAGGSSKAGASQIASLLGAASGAAVALTAAIAAVAAAVVAVVAVVAMADSQAKDFNKSMLEGAGAADFALGKASSAGLDLNETLDAGQEAAIGMAMKWRVQADEFTKMLGELNAAGLTYKEMTKDAKSAEEVQARFADHMRVTLVASKSLGLSVAETAEVMAAWTSDFGGDIKVLETQFAAVSDAAALSGMNTKRFFSTVSQATAGMALYNNRMGEAAALLAQTSKILGDTDASDFIKSLTKGFADQSYVDRFKNIMISGVDDVRKVLAADSKKMARDFSASFKDNAKVKAVLGADLFLDTDTMIKTLGGKSDKQVREMVQKLRESGEAAAARQVESMAKLAKAQKGGVTEMAKGLDQLSMGGKLAMKMQGLGDKRISEMSGIELAAFEQYSGIGGEQLEQLRRMDSALIGEWESIQGMAALQKDNKALSEEQTRWLKENNITIDKDGKITKKNQDGTISVIEDLNEYTIAHGDLLTDISKIEDESAFYTRQSLNATTSILSYLQTGMARILKDIYDMITEVYSKMPGSNLEALKLQRQMKEGADRNSAELTEKLNEQLAAIESQEKIIATKGANSEEGKKAADELARLKDEKKLTETKLAHSEQFAREIMRGETAQQLASKYGSESGAGAAAVGALALVNPAQVFEDYGMATSSVGVQQERAAEIAKIEADMAAKAQAREDAANAAKWQGPVQEPEVYNYEDQVSMSEGYPADPLMEDATSMQEEQTSMQEEANMTLGDLYSAVEDANVMDEKGMRADKKWTDIQFQKKSTDAAIDAGRKLKAVDLAAKLGYTGTDMENVASALVEGIASDAVKTKITTMGLENDASGFGTGVATYKKADDFVMRPGQPPQPFNSNDTILGFKPGGPIAGAGGGGTVNITINGGDQAKVYQTVKDALKNSGLR